jgi:nitrite reductase/ring-hydroxylating ferredoxin subunit
MENHLQDGRREIVTWLCASADLLEGAAKGVTLGTGAGAREILLLRKSGAVHAYVNSCPHQGTPLETFPDRFFSADGKLLICSTHGARFRPDDGFCISGPCKGKSLTRLGVRETQDSITLCD